MPDKDDVNLLNRLGREELLRLIVDFFHRIAMHHAMWFNEVQHQWGRAKAYEILKRVYQKSGSLQVNRLAKTIGNENIAGLSSFSREKLVLLKNAIAANWLANDGIWFQALEFSQGMADAKRCNDSVWVQFSPFEAWSTMNFLNLPKQSGLTGLKKALQFRMYASINRQSISAEDDDGFTFRMEECRVQVARKRKGLDDYPCKSAGMVEFPTIAGTIDDRIKTRCVACPPDDHPQEWYCAWRFFIEKEPPTTPGIEE